MILDGEQEEQVREIVRQEIRTFAALYAYELGRLDGAIIPPVAVYANALTNASDRLLRDETAVADGDGFPPVTIRSEP